MNDIIKSLEAEGTEVRKAFPDFKAGDTVNVHVKITEGNKERIQQFQGTVIQRRILTPTVKPLQFVKFPME